MEEKKILVANKLASKNPSTLKMVLGFDGFIDEIIHLVDKRLDSRHFTRIETISEFAERINRASGLSTNIELVPVQRKIGGNGPIMCNALSKHTSAITYIGALGLPVIDEVFKELETNAKLISIAQSGHTDALEFHDGKLLFGKMISLNDVTYDKLILAIGKDKLISLLSETDLFATVNWSMLPYMTELWQKLLYEVLPLLPKRSKRPIFFVDLADPEKRESEEIIEAISLLKAFSEYFYVVLGLNKKEAYDIAKVLELYDRQSLEHMQVSLQEVNEALYDFVQIDAVVIHPVDRSATVVDGMYYEEIGPYAKKPKLTTGAGDNFNAGFILGLLLDLSPEEALMTGMATSGFYVRNAKSPTYDELIHFLREWANDNV